MKIAFPLKRALDSLGLRASDFGHFGYFFRGLRQDGPKKDIFVIFIDFRFPLGIPWASFSALFGDVFFVVHLGFSFLLILTKLWCPLGDPEQRGTCDL